MVGLGGARRRGREEREVRGEGRGELVEMGGDVTVVGGAIGGSEGRLEGGVMLRGSTEEMEVVRAGSNTAGDKR